MSKTPTSIPASAFAQDATRVVHDLQASMAEIDAIIEEDEEGDSALATSRRRPPSR